MHAALFPGGPLNSVSKASVHVCHAVWILSVSHVEPPTHNPFRFLFKRWVEIQNIGRPWCVAMARALVPPPVNPMSHCLHIAETNFDVPTPSIRYPRQQL